MSKAKLKILCLHGYRQNGETFRQKNGGFRKQVKSLADFVHITANHKVPPLTGQEVTNDDEKETEDQRGWFFTSKQQTYTSKELESDCVGFEESLEQVEKVFQENGPFDGVLAFSQGGAFLSILCALQQQGALKGKFNFAIFVSSFKSRCQVHRQYYNDVVVFPTMHIYGETDNVIPKEMSEDLVTAYKDPAVFIHPGGHHVPSTSTLKQSLRQFLENQIENRH